MLALGLAWLALTVVELTQGLNPLLEGASTAIWAIFIIEFALRLAIAPRKWAFIKENWLSLLSLLVPALRLLRIARLARLLQMTRVARGLRLFRVVSSINRGMKILGRSLGRRGFGYVVGLTALVTLLGAAGIYAFEQGEGVEIDSYGSALWWTAMLMTTMGSDYWPRSGEGRVLTLFLSLYAFAVFGYVTATLASFFIERDVREKEVSLEESGSVEGLRAEITALRAEVRALAGGMVNPALSPPAPVERGTPPAGRAGGE
jgi:voltage-gated potassium channel